MFGQLFTDGIFFHAIRYFIPIIENLIQIFLEYIHTDVEDKTQKFHSYLLQITVLPQISSLN